MTILIVVSEIFNPFKKATPLSGGTKKGVCDKFKDQLTKDELKDCNKKCGKIKNKTQRQKCIARFL